MYEIKYTWEAQDDLDGIFDYISKHNRVAAVKLLNKIEKSILLLKDNPRMGSVVPKSAVLYIESGYRKIYVHPYLIFYRIGLNEVYISRVLHSKQDWLYLLFNSKFDE
jgi:toxin ParE1/3/4